jgi:hypothetical protein
MFALKHAIRHEDPATAPCVSAGIQILSGDRLARRLRASSLASLTSPSNFQSDMRRNRESTLQSVLCTLLELWGSSALQSLLGIHHVGKDRIDPAQMPRPLRSKPREDIVLDAKRNKRRLRSQPVRHHLRACSSVNGAMSETSIADSGFCASRASRSRCVFVIGLLKIRSALTLTSFSGRDDADNFFAIACLPINMYYQKNEL